MVSIPSPMPSIPLQKAVIPLRIVDPDLARTGPDLAKSGPDLAKSGPDLAKAEPDLAKDIRDLARAGPEPAGHLTGVDEFLLKWALVNAHHRSSFGFCFLILAIVSDMIAQDSPLVAAAKRAKKQPALISTLQLVPDIRTVRWFNSKHTTLRDFKGQVLLIDFWATWCGTCVSAHQELQALARDLGPDGFTVVLIHSRYTKTGAGRGIDTPAENVLPKFIADHKIFGFEIIPVSIRFTHLQFSPRRVLIGISRP